MAYTFFDKKTVGGVCKNEIMQNKELVEEHKPIIRKFEKRNAHSSFVDNIWGADLADMQLWSKFNEGFCFLLCIIDTYSKYAWVIPSKHKKGITITNTFQKMLVESGYKPNKIWVDNGSEFYNRSMKSWLEKNDYTSWTKICSCWKFIRTLKNKTYKYMTSVLKNVYIDKLDDIVNKYNNMCHSTIKMKPVDVKWSTYIDFDKKNNKEDPNLKVGDHVRISKYKNIFEKGYLPNWSEENSVVTKFKNAVLWTYVIGDLNGEEIFGTFFNKELQKANQDFTIEKVIKRKGDKLYVKCKWKGYDNSFNSWIDKKDIVI